MSSIWRHCALICANLLAAAGPTACDLGDPVLQAPSAGCLVLRGDTLLVVDVRDPPPGYTVPGGGVDEGETVACAARRESLEETGLDVIPGAVLRVFPTGFHLLQCELEQPDAQLPPPASWEVRSAHWLPLSELENVRWRYPGQGADLQEIIHDLRAGEPPSATPGQ